VLGAVGLCSRHSENSVQINVTEVLLICLFSYLSFYFYGPSIEKPEPPKKVDPSVPNISLEREMMMRKSCRQTLTYSSRFPGKVDFEWGSTNFFKNDKGHFVLNGGVELMNGLGMMLPHRYRCEMDRNGAVLNSAVIQG
jgi:hypothetical protein